MRSLTQAPAPANATASRVTAPKAFSDSDRRLDFMEFALMVCARLPEKPPGPTAGDRERQDCAERYAEFCRAVGPRLKTATLANYQCDHPGQLATVEALRDYMERMPAEIEAGNGIVLFGPSGTGKDHLLAALGKTAIRDHGLTVAWQYGPDLFGEIRDRIARNEPEESWVSRLAGPDVLILSDPLPTRGELTTHQAAMLQRVLDRRYRLMRPTWASVNVRSGQEADERMGAAIVDRLKHGAVIAYCSWPSFRQPRASVK